MSREAENLPEKALIIIYFESGLKESIRDHRSQMTGGKILLGMPG